GPSPSAPATRSACPTSPRPSAPPAPERTNRRGGRRPGDGDDPHRRVPPQLATGVEGAGTLQAERHPAPGDGRDAGPVRPDEPEAAPAAGAGVGVVGRRPTAQAGPAPLASLAHAL